MRSVTAAANANKVSESNPRLKWGHHASPNPAFSAATAPAAASRGETGSPAASDPKAASTRIFASLLPPGTGTLFTPRRNPPSVTRPGGARD